MKEQDIKILPIEVDPEMQKIIVQQNKAYQDMFLAIQKALMIPKKYFGNEKDI